MPDLIIEKAMSYPIDDVFHYDLELKCNFKKDKMTTKEWDKFDEIRWKIMEINNLFRELK